MYHTSFSPWLIIILMSVGLSIRFALLKLSHSHPLLKKFVTSSWPQVLIIFILPILAVFPNFKLITPAIIFWLFIFNLSIDAVIFWLDTPPKK